MTNTRGVRRFASGGSKIAHCCDPITTAQIPGRNKAESDPKVGESRAGEPRAESFGHLQARATMGAVWCQRRRCKLFNRQLND
jgi:hypothetical protein